MKSLFTVVTVGFILISSIVVSLSGINVGSNSNVLVPSFNISDEDSSNRCMRHLSENQRHYS